MSDEWKKYGGGRQLIYGVVDNGTAYPFKGSQFGDSDYIGHDVFVQDQHTQPFVVPFHRPIETGLALGSAPVPGDWDITLAPGHGFTGAGEAVLIMQSTALQIVETTAVVGNVLSLDEQISFPFTIGSATVERVSTSLKTDGSTARQEFVAYPPPGSDHDITGIRLTMITATEPDDSMFGDLGSALPRGLNFCLETAEGIPVSLGAFHTNGDFARIAGDLEYSDKAGGGAFSVRVDAKVRANWGVTIRARGTVSVGTSIKKDVLCITAQDDLTGLDDIQANYYGHVVSP
jgi:hypothetical protein